MCVIKGPRVTLKEVKEPEKLLAVLLEQDDLSFFAVEVIDTTFVMIYLDAGDKDGHEVSYLNGDWHPQP